MAAFYRRLSAHSLETLNKFTRIPHNISSGDIFPTVHVDQERSTIYQLHSMNLKEICDFREPVLYSFKLHPTYFRRQDEI